MKYRRRLTSDVWHFHPRCRWWPVVLWLYIEQDRKPTTFEFCNECIRKSKRGAA